MLAEAPRGRELTGAEAGRLLAAYGLAPLPRRVVPTPPTRSPPPRSSAIPVAVKATAESLRHRPDLGAVRLDLADDAAVRAAVAALAVLDGAPVVVQRMAPPGVATVVEVLDDPSFGALVSFGIGGVATDLLGDRAYAPVPLSDLDAAELVAAPRAAPLLAGHRGAEPVDTGALDGPAAAGVPAGRGPARGARPRAQPGPGRPRRAVVLSARATVGPPTARADPGPRRRLLTARPRRAPDSAAAIGAAQAIEATTIAATARCAAAVTIATGCTGPGRARI